MVAIKLTTIVVSWLSELVTVIHSYDSIEDLSLFVYVFLIQ